MEDWSATSKQEAKEGIFLSAFFFLVLAPFAMLFASDLANWVVVTSKGFETSASVSNFCTRKAKVYLPRRGSAPRDHLADLDWVDQAGHWNSYRRIRLNYLVWERLKAASKEQQFIKIIYAPSPDGVPVWEPVIVEELPAVRATTIAGSFFCVIYSIISLIYLFRNAQVYRQRLREENSSTFALSA